MQSTIQTNAQWPWQKDKDETGYSPKPDRSNQSTRQAQAEESQDSVRVRSSQDGKR
ncbi:hypothetical protein THICB1_30327 [Thiomonas arsenitoxydans]|uniref:Uncharacterized protein n=1 Tax=Thiomonas arsenitoxydans (strain DSM 22701 / CIP 110005 / 3As) TaxID=426114 RepID=A0ABM9T7L9_THIA3|nr:hypothetical protein ACO7_340007 [Thiomonas arsenitoxydans]CQR32889.1 hypothetical protein ACO3_360007 [Thiomonas arsenitoxydans]CQR34116.1 hypothetical protein THICB1_30327 [Thiomonas arsenitoxydans]CQR40403.1 hypothetical protein THICB6_80328 [Thiomonas arsenitoxydans]